MRAAGPPGDASSTGTASSAPDAHAAASSSDLMSPPTPRIAETFQSAISPQSL